MADVINQKTQKMLGFENDFLLFVERDLRIHLHFAHLHEHQANDLDLDLEQRLTNLGLAATHYRRAAAHTLLVQNRSREWVEQTRLFENTVNIYQQLHMPYALLLSSFLPHNLSKSGEDYLWSDTPGGPDTETAQKNRRIQYLYLLLFEAAQHGEMLRDLRQEMETYRSHPIGVLGLPVGIYLDLVDALAEGRSALELDVAQALAPILTSYDQAIRHAMRNKYFWTQLAQPFHPAEPDIFGLLLLIRRRIEQKFDINIQRLSERLFIAEPTRILITGILENFEEGQ